MAKRGERRPWKVRYEWSNGIKGTDSYTSRDQAEMKAEQIRRTAVARDMVVTVDVTHRP
jgi:hypothetical protein